MRLIETLRIVFTNIIQNKIKMMLTSLGIIVGTATIVLVIAIGRGGEEEVMQQFSGLSAETIYVNRNYTMGGNQMESKIPPLTMDLMEQIMEESTTLSAAYLRGTTYKEITVGSEKEYVAISGVTNQYEKVSNLVIAYGDGLSDEDMEQATNAVVIGDTIANQYFGSPEKAIGNTLRIGQRTYVVIGVLQRSGDGLQGVNVDETIFLPYSTAEKYLFDDMTMPQIVALASKMSLVEKAKAEMRSTIDYVLEDGSVYLIEDTGSRIEAATKSARTMKMLLISVAAIVFLVGGIGIMNVLFLSVKERTREIGILKALGSPKSEIMLQFLLESISISLFGGIVGIIVSYYLLPLMKYTDIPVATSIDGPMIALFFAIVTGTIFGIYPAWKASQLKPIEALNHE